MISKDEIKVGQRWEYNSSDTHYIAIIVKIINDEILFHLEKVFKIELKFSHLFSHPCDDYEYSMDYKDPHWTLLSDVKDKMVHCKKCKIINDYAEPNQEDGSYICYNCRN